MNFADLGDVCHRIEGEEENVCYTRQVYGGFTDSRNKMRFPPGSPAYKELQRRFDRVRAANRDLTEAELDKKLYAVRAEYVREMRKKWGMPTDD